MCLWRQVVGNGKVSEKCLEPVFLLSVEIHLEGLGVLQRTKRCLAVFRLELIVVVGDVAYKLKEPSLRRLVGQVGLIVQERRLVLSLRVGGP